MHVILTNAQLLIRLIRYCVCVALVCLHKYIKPRNVDLILFPIRKQTYLFENLKIQKVFYDW